MLGGRVHKRLPEGFRECSLVRVPSVYVMHWSNQCLSDGPRVPPPIRLADTLIHPPSLPTFPTSTIKSPIFCGACPQSVLFLGQLLTRASKNMYL